MGLVKEDKVSPVSKRYIVAVVDLDRATTKYNLSNSQVDTFLWLAKASLSDAVKFASLHGERSSKLTAGKAIYFRLFDKLAVKKFELALQQQRPE